MGLLKAVCLDSMLARLASARLPVRRCDLVLCVLGSARTLWWLPMLPRWDSEPPLGTASSESESASWYFARRCAVGRGIRATGQGEAGPRRWVRRAPATPPSMGEAALKEGRRARPLICACAQPAAVDILDPFHRGDISL